MVGSAALVGSSNLTHPGICENVELNVQITGSQVTALQDWYDRHGTALTQEDITAMVPVTNPFLKEMLEEFLKVGGRASGVDFDELGISDVVELLRDDETDLPAVTRDFGKRQPGEDPVIHFYETFLKAYNKELRVKRGVFYTPQPVVSYIVRSVHERLQTEFHLDHGLAEPQLGANFPRI